MASWSRPMPSPTIFAFHPSEHDPQEMLEILDELYRALSENRDVAVCKLVETRGSTPQKAGATMLVYPDGSQGGTLGGGCVEAEVKRQAILRIQDRTAEIATFQLDSDYGWDDGLICGGRMKVLIDPLPNVDATEYYLQLSRLAREKQATTEAIAFDQHAFEFAVPCAVLCDKAGNVMRSLRIDAPAGIKRLVSGLKPLGSRPQPYAEGGIAYLPLLEKCRLIIIGGGHVGKAVAELASQLDFDVWIVDDREAYVSEERFPTVARRLSGDIDNLLAELETDENTYSLIVTRGHHHDEKALYHMIKKPARYIGMIGSRRKIKMIFEDLRAEGIDSAALEKVFAPVGIDIGSQTVPEIAVSIAAELVAHRNLAGRVPARPT